MMSHLLADQAQREAALDTTRSFIVQAPAGSGKTELLVQRYLALLSVSSAPECVLAITFTRKAALEMRARVMEALYSVTTHSLPPTEAHQKVRWKLAYTLHQWEKNKGWNLLREPYRLQIQTIDAFYHHLIQNISSPSSFYATATLNEYPLRLYQEAIQQLFSQLESDSKIGQALVTLSEHLDNDRSQIESLLTDMLSQRDQWYRMVQDKTDNLNVLRSLLEKSLEHICQKQFQKVAALFDQTTLKDWKAQLTDVIEHFLAYSSIEKESEQSDHSFWSLTATMLLNQKGQWRKTIFRPKNYTPADQAQYAIFSNYKQKLKEILRHVNTCETLRLALFDVQSLPILSDNGTQWPFLQDLLLVLKTLLASLEIVFEAHNQIDYIALSLQALHVLGKEEEPTDTLLRLDYQIQHILIDEFQDVSLQQLQFFNKLTEGWQEKEGRTLFFVGDPMQSIYRFRNAEPRLFKTVQCKGLVACKLEQLILSTNFRATPSLIQWTNSHFAAMELILHNQYQRTNGFASSTSLKQDIKDDITSVQTHWLYADDHQAELVRIVQIVKHTLSKVYKPTSFYSENSKTPSIAILGRTRQHLIPIVAALQKENINYQAVEIENFIDKPLVQDLLMLTRAITHLEDTIAWLALLRAPWCGITLQDLHHLTNACQSQNPSTLIWDQLENIDALSITEASKVRLQKLKEILTPVIKSYARIPLEQCIQKAWLALGGPALQVGNIHYRQEMQTFFQCLRQVQTAEMLIDIQHFEAKLQQLHLEYKASGRATLILMTIHKAKGLEFDTVIIPNCHQTIRYSHYPLFLYDEGPHLSHNQIFFAAIKANTEANQNSIYRYLRQIDQIHNQAEVIRLLYVACTRAKKTLHLLGTFETANALTVKWLPGSFLYWIWPVLKIHQKEITTLKKIASDPIMPSKLKRIALSDYSTLMTLHAPPTLINEKANIDEEKIAPTIVETIVRVLLKNLYQMQASFFDLYQKRSSIVAGYQNVIDTLLMQKGLCTPLNERRQAIMHHLLCILEDIKGRWILSQQTHVISSYQFSTLQEGIITNHFIDHCFIDDTKKVWIIQYRFDSSASPLSLLANAIFSQKTQIIRKHLSHTTQNDVFHIGFYWPLERVWQAVTDHA